MLNNGADTLQVFDISDPASPVSVGSVAASNNIEDRVFVQDHYAYVASAESSTLRIYNIATSTSPTLVGTATLNSGSYGSIFVQGRYAVVGTGSFLQIFDVSTPSAPSLVGSLNTPTYEIFVTGRYVYMIEVTGNTLKTFDLGGGYIQQLEVGSAEISTLAIKNAVRIGTDATIGGGLNVLGSFNALTASSVYASSTQPALKITQSLGGNVLDLYTGSTAALTFTVGARLGISSTSPISAFAISTTTPIITLGDTQSSGLQYRLRNGSVAAGTFDIYEPVANTSRLVITSSGNVGIGTTSPVARLSVTSAGTGTGSAFAVADSANIQRFTILDNGSVGIATSSPGRTLSTEGDELISSTATTTVHIHSTGSQRGGCLQFTGASGAYFHAYATTTGPLILNAGGCK